MYGALDISSSALVAQRRRLDAISANMALAGAAVDPSADPDAFRRRVVLLAPGDPATGRDQGVHVRAVALDRAPFELRHEPDHPFADDRGYVRYPSISTSIELVNALEASRAYEANITAAEATKAMLQSTLRLLA